MPIDFSGIKTTKNRKYRADKIAQLNDALKDIPIKQRAAILGSIIEESGGEPLARSANSTYQGLLQWGHDRYTINPLATEDEEFQKQVSYIRDTINNTSDKVSWTHGGAGSGYNSYKEAYADFTNEQSPLDPTFRAFSFGYVRPKGKTDSYQNRLKVAQQVYDRLYADEQQRNSHYQAKDFRDYEYQFPKRYSDGGSLNTSKSWNDLSLTEKAEMMKVAIQNGITTLPEIRQKYNEFARGGYIPSEEAKQRITKWEGKAMTGAVDPLSGKYAKNNSFESEARGFYNALPENIREQVLSNQELADSLYSYSYNVGAGNFKRRVVPALQRYYAGNGSIEDIQESMWASGDKKLRGLQRRRAEERQGVKNALLRNTPAFSSVQDSTPLFDYVPMNSQAFESPLATYQPTIVFQEPEQPIVKAAMEEAYSPEQIERAERQDRLNKFGMLLSMMNPRQQNSLTGTIGMLTGNAFADGGNIYDDGGSYSYTKPLDNVFVDSEGNLLDPSVPSARGTVQLPEVIVNTRDPRKPVPTAFDGSIAPWLEVGEMLAKPLNVLSPSQQFGAVADAVQGKRNYFESAFNGNSGFFTDQYAQQHPYLTMAGNFGGDILSGAALSKVPKLAASTYKGIVQPGMRLFNSPLALRPQYSSVTQRSIGNNASTGTMEETAKAVEKGRETLLDWVRSPFYKARLEDEPLYRVADDVVTDASTMIRNVPVEVKERSLLEDFANGVTSPRPFTEKVLPDGTIIRDFNTGLDVAVASDLGENADNVTLHELLHYMTSNSKGTPISKAGEKIIERGWFAPTDAYYNVIGVINRTRGKRWQNYVTDQNNALLPKYDNVVKMVMEEPDKAKAALLRMGRTEEQAEAAVNSLRERYSYWYDIQEQRAHLQELFLSKIKPHLKNPNDAAEIETFLTEHPEVLENSSPYKYIQEVRPGSLKEYAGYFASALGTIPFILNSQNNERERTTRD